MGEQPRVKLTLTAKPSQPPAAPAARMRADLLMVEQGVVKSRNRAAAEIRAGQVYSGERKVEAPSDMLDASVPITLKQRHNPYVSRGGLKLAHALDQFGVSPKGLVCLDIGASTGGFSQVLIERGAARVYAVDVGEKQFHESLRSDPRIVVLEKTDARQLTRQLVPEPPGLIVADVSFISLMLALPQPLSLAAPGARLIALVKPQFEAGKGRTSKGVVRDTLTMGEVVNRIRVWLGAQAGWRVVGAVESPVKGGDGNTEFLLCAEHS